MVAKDQKWHKTLQLERASVKLKLDTGAIASELPIAVFRQASPEMRLTETSTWLQGCNNSIVRPHGTATIHTRWRNHSVTYFVSTGVGGPILGQDECEALQLVQTHAFFTGNHAPVHMTWKTTTYRPLSRAILRCGWVHTVMYNTDRPKRNSRATSFQEATICEGRQTQRNPHRPQAERCSPGWIWAYPMDLIASLWSLRRNPVNCVST